MRSKSPPSYSERAPAGLTLAAIGALLFLHVPLLIIFLYSFTTDEATYTFPLPGLTTKWFGVALQRADLWAALTLSVRVAVIATLPALVTGIALRSAIGTPALPFSYWTIVIGHATFCVVVVYNNVLARFSRMSGSQIEASMDLGANSFQTFRYVILPNIGTALLAGGMLAFALSFDEVIVTTFTAGQQSTLPIWIFSQLVRPRDRPVTNVVATIVILITFLPIFFAQRISETGR